MNYGLSCKLGPANQQPRLSGLWPDADGINLVLAVGADADGQVSELETLLETADGIAISSVSTDALARAMAVPPRRINEIVLGKRGITADTAVRLAAALGTSERFWLGLQADYDLEEARRALGELPGRIKRLAA